MDTETPLHEILLERERKCPHFLTYTERPKFIENIHTTSDFSRTQGHHPPAPEWVLDMPWGEIMKDKPAVA